jgi:hypothetical protein
LQESKRAYRTASGSNKWQVSCYVLEAMNVGYVTLLPF